VKPPCDRPRPAPTSRYQRVVRGAVRDRPQRGDRGDRRAAGAAGGPSGL